MAPDRAQRPRPIGPAGRSVGVLLAALVGLAASPAFAGSGARILGVRVAHRGPRFSIAMRMTLRESPQAVFAALQDYRAMPRYNPDLRRVRVEPTSQPNQVLLFTTVHVCVLVFCRTLHQEQLMTAAADARGGTLHASLIPGGSFRSGHAHWTVRPCAGKPIRTCMDVHIVLEPAFWVPPVIGPWILRHKMYREALRSGIGLARVARRMEGTRPGKAPRSAHAQRGKPNAP